MYLCSVRSGYFLGLLPEKAWLLGAGLAHVLTHIVQEGCRQLVVSFSGSVYGNLTEGIRRRKLGLPEN